MMMMMMSRRRFSQVYTEQTVPRLQARNVKFARGGSIGVAPVRCVYAQCPVHAVHVACSHVARRVAGWYSLVTRSRVIAHRRLADSGGKA